MSLADLTDQKGTGVIRVVVNHMALKSWSFVCQCTIGLRRACSAGLVGLLCMRIIMVYSVDP